MLVVIILSSMRLADKQEQKSRTQVKRKVCIPCIGPIFRPILLSYPVHGEFLSGGMLSHNPLVS